jgi:hypothetical protein
MQHFDAQAVLELNRKRVRRQEILRQVNVDFVDNLNLIVVDIFRLARSHGGAKIDSPSTQTDRAGVKKVKGPTFFYEIITGFVGNRNHNF